ncbi:MAG: penicillin-binding protein 2 [Clostridia bacterium]|nr:penicillin-binding protein 2 [Clostridia bacterium]
MKTRRYIIFYVLFALTALMIGARLINLQIANGNYYREKSNSRTVRSVELAAPRGEILDRNGRAIVSNRTGYNVYILSNRERTSAQLNKVINNLSKAVKSKGRFSDDVLPISVTDDKYEFYTEKEESRKWKKTNGYKENDSAQKVMDSLCEKYGIDTEKYTKKKILAIAATRIDMVKRGFSMASPYLFAEDIPIEEISVIKEQAEKFPDVSIITQPVRNYPYPTLGAHILGRVGMISAQEYEENEDDGYNINSHIGKDGIEKYLEKHLRGENGSGRIEQTRGGYSVGHNVEKEPIAGKSVNLTIDLDMQLASEKALRDTIYEISSASDSAEGGRDASSGSIVVIDVNSGDVLAMASYPSYDIKNFGAMYNELVSNPSKPLFNRALSGTYSPASTFKLLVGAAALEEGVITTDEEIFDSGKYTYFSDYQPACWIYNQKGVTHGYLNVSEAIRDSCNIFFYETGRRLTIEKINNYATLFGFGQKSGIELSAEEKSGVVASPENRKKNGGIWYPGDTCQTAIGQSDTLVTPLQLANYIATIANGGTRYKPHLIKSLAGEETQRKSEVLSKINLKEENRAAVVDGLRRVVTEGTAFTAFQGCKISVAAKTGSAQTSGVYTNGVCVAYAPYEKPQIAIACVIEKAGSGSHVAKAVRRVVDSYFDSSDEDNMKTNVLVR